MLQSTFFTKKTTHRQNQQNSQLKSQPTLIFLTVLKAEMKKGKVNKQILEEHNENDIKMRVAV